MNHTVKLQNKLTGKFITREIWASGRIRARQIATIGYGAEYRVVTVK